MPKFCEKLPGVWNGQQCCRSVTLDDVRLLKLVPWVASQAARGPGNTGNYPLQRSLDQISCGDSRLAMEECDVSSQWVSELGLACMHLPKNVAKKFFVHDGTAENSDKSTLLDAFVCEMILVWNNHQLVQLMNLLFWDEQLWLGGVMRWLGRLEMCQLSNSSCW